MTGWNFADVYEAIAAAVPDRPCQINGKTVVTWREFDRRANALASDLFEAGLTRQSKVAAYLYNGPEYIETYIAAFKGGFVPVNTNYRYGPDEVVYLWDNADAEAVVFHATFTDLVDKIRDRLPRVRRWYVVPDESNHAPSWATHYGDVIGRGGDHFEAPWGRSGDDLLLLYTGGTTGMPKGVMWRQDDLFNVLGGGGQQLLGIPPATSVAELASRLEPSSPQFVMLTACPLMHGTGQFSALISMNLGGSVVSLPSRQFRAEELWREVERTRATALVIVGQAFAAPMLEHLDANPGRYDFADLKLISSSGVMWSQENKDGLLRHVPGAILFDSYGSSEAVGLGGSVSTKDAASETARFVLGPNCAVFTDDDRKVEPGSGEQGMVGVSGFIPVGYYKDEVKTAQTFRMVEGRRWSVPGDWAEVNADGSLHLLGRGSVCINTGGEKVFPEEVEEVIRTHPRVRDVVAVGVPDTRFGEAIAAVIEPDGAAPDLEAISEHVKLHLAAYKAPRHVVVVDTIGRAANGKVDYKRLKAIAADRLGKS